MENIPYLKITAKNNYELGFKIGVKLKDRIKKRLSANKKLYQKMRTKNFTDLAEMALKFLPATEKHFPELVIEAQALSRGADVKFEELMVLMCEEELIDLNVPKCTSVALKTKDAVLVGHNEDWLNSYRNNGLYILNCEMGKHRSLSLNYIGSLPGSSCGLNSRGLCFTANSLSARRFHYGVPIKFQFRAILASKNMRQAVNSDLADSSICGNTIYGWKNSRILDVEDYFGHHEIFSNKKILIHTNHPILSGDQNKTNTSQESIRRYKRAAEILKQEKDYNLAALKKILTDHEAKICSHPIKHTFWGSTIASTIMNPKEKWMEICSTNPCKNKYTRYYL
ncbi:hypothetical protein COT99_03580 [Candidatus Falkowbacteria bacterium CG10_big_fil_rev_8_21_14_0_10_43_10]|uniref:Peptidase C45 hydrolase domain-containing protein n=1 Tax=Candidatus Falkowbacteria bacterium CG10_big_fil_rev_8_21_14_0_10_43_10 TaxID=1974567 RepID=A0A2H0V3L1_9BACT|nr:MAG: hypothetical protein COT99_03580 [Candidatus Falkowbacteria bacterium CG10_big_fil_rev_8_21_14_0_10_43_10]